MQRLRLFGALLAGSCLVAGTVAAEPASKKTTPKKHAECEGSKMKTACNNQLDVKAFVQGLQAPPTSQPPVDADQSAKLRQSEPAAKADGGPTQPQR